MVLLLLFVSCAQAEEFSIGKHYEVLQTPSVTRDPSKVEVVEVFWFGCNHCYSLEAYLQPWKKSLPEYVDFWKSPVVSGWHTSAQTHARLFYASKALNIQDQAVFAAFNAIQREGKLLSGETELEYFFRGFGIDKERIRSVINSFGVKNAVKQADSRTRKWQVTGVPTLIVNGKYKVSATRELSTQRLLEVVDFLVKKERKSTQNRETPSSYQP